MDSENSPMQGAEETNGESIILYKILIILFLFCLSFFFGYLPAKISYFTTNYKLIGIANSFSGGIFLCVALLHLLPESAEIFEEYFEHTNIEDDEGNHVIIHKHFPISFLLAFIGYTIILIIEKVIFDSHTHLEGDDEDAENPEDAKLLTDEKAGDEREIQQINMNNNFNITIPLKDCLKQSMNIDENCIKRYLDFNKVNLNLNNQSELNTRSISIISKGKKNRIKNYLETFKLDTIEKNEEHFKNLFSNTGKISMILEKDNKIKQKNSTNSDMRKVSVINNLNYPLMSNIPEIKEEKTKHDKKHDSFTPYLLLVALSIHACFEGLALGLQGSLSEIFYMFLAISFHKWVEALSIGINLNKSKIEKQTIRKFILLFSSMTPLGLVFGMIFSGFSEITEAIFLSISAGSFLYISASEVVIEEFSVSKNKYEKFLGFIGGASIICVMTIFEHHH